MNRPQYLMENDDEGSRLRTKTNTSSTREQLLLTGLSHVPAGSVVIDAGSGSGVVSGVMQDVLESNAIDSTIKLLDLSGQRLSEARGSLKSGKHTSFSFSECSLENIPLESNCADFIFSRFVFEYLQDPRVVLAELIRILKPGGRIVIGDLDYNCMTHYPLEERLDKQLLELTAQISNLGLLDPFVGRKLYTWFYSSQLKDIKVHVFPHHLFYGKLPSSDFTNWQAKLHQLEKLQESKKLQLSFKISDFADTFLAFLQREDRFSYTPLILVEASK